MECPARQNDRLLKIARDKKPTRKKPVERPLNNGHKSEFRLLFAD